MPTDVVAIKTLSLTLFLVLGLLAVTDSGAVLVDLEQSYELDAALVTVPSTSTGYVLFRACSQCSVRSMRVDNNTQYFLGNTSVTLAEFHEDAVMQGLIYVFYEADSEIVTRVRLRAGGPEDD